MRSSRYAAILAAALLSGALGGGIVAAVPGAISALTFGGVTIQIDQLDDPQVPDTTECRLLEEVTSPYVGGPVEFNASLAMPTCLMTDSQGAQAYIWMDTDPAHADYRATLDEIGAQYSVLCSAPTDIQFMFGTDDIPITYCLGPAIPGGPWGMFAVMEYRGVTVYMQTYAPSTATDQTLVGSLAPIAGKVSKFLTLTGS